MIIKLREFSAEIFKALAHPARVHILEVLREYGEMSVGELCDEVNLQGSNVSQQLSILRAKNIVKSRKDANSVYYSITDPTIAKLLDACKKVFNKHLESLQLHIDDAQKSCVSLAFMFVLGV
jgi:ArsR family transcriptional regulator